MLVAPDPIPSHYPGCRQCIHLYVSIDPGRRLDFRQRFQLFNSLVGIAVVGQNRHGQDLMDCEVGVGRLNWVEQRQSRVATSRFEPK